MDGAGPSRWAILAPRATPTPSSSSRASHRSSHHAATSLVRKLHPTKHLKRPHRHHHHTHNATSSTPAPSPYYYPPQPPPPPDPTPEWASGFSSPLPLTTSTAYDACGNPTATWSWTESPYPTDAATWWSSSTPTWTPNPSVQLVCTPTPHWTTLSPVGGNVYTDTPDAIAASNTLDAPFLAPSSSSPSSSTADGSSSAGHDGGPQTKTVVAAATVGGLLGLAAIALGVAFALRRRTSRRLPDFPRANRQSSFYGLGVARASFASTADRSILAATDEPSSSSNPSSSDVLTGPSTSSLAIGGHGPYMTESGYVLGSPPTSSYNDLSTSHASHLVASSAALFPLASHGSSHGSDGRALSFEPPLRRKSSHRLSSFPFFPPPTLPASPSRPASPSVGPAATLAALTPGTHDSYSSSRSGSSSSPEVVFVSEEPDSFSHPSSSEPSLPSDGDHHHHSTHGLGLGISDSVTFDAPSRRSSRGSRAGGGPPQRRRSTMVDPYSSRRSSAPLSVMNPDPVPSPTASSSRTSAPPGALAYPSSSSQQYRLPSMGPYLSMRPGWPPVGASTTSFATVGHGHSRSTLALGSAFPRSVTEESLSYLHHLDGDSATPGSVGPVASTSAAAEAQGEGGYFVAR